MAHYSEQAIIDQAFKENENWTTRPKIPVPKVDLKPGILECLKKLTCDASQEWALCDSVANPTNPGIRLKTGVGIGLPLSDGDAKALISASYQSPGEKGDIAEWTARSSWEFSTKEFDLTNPEFEFFVDGIVKKVTASLGVDGAGEGARAELHKMTLRSQGSQHLQQDHETIPMKFATLEICLPSEHEGGEAQVSHNGQSQTLQTAGSSQFGSTYLAWFVHMPLEESRLSCRFSDVSHEAKSIIKGRRLSLTYNLFHKSLGPNELGFAANMPVTKLRSLLSSWKCDLRDKMSPFQYFTYMLDARYAESSLSFGSLEGNDRTVLSRILQLCDELELVVYLANMEVSVMGTCRMKNKIDDVDEMLTSLLKVVDPEGKVVAENMKYDPYFVEGDNLAAFNGKEPDEIHDDTRAEDQGYNEWSDMRHVYHQTVAIIMPKSFRPVFFFGPGDLNNDPWGGCDASSQDAKPKVIEWIADLFDAPDFDDGVAIRNDIKHICRVVISQMRKYEQAQRTIRPGYHPERREQVSISDDTLEYVIMTCIKLEDPNLLADAIFLFPQRARPTDEFLSKLGAAILRHRLKDSLSVLSRRFPASNNFASRYDTLKAIRAGMNEEGALNLASNQTYNSWIDYEIRRAMNVTEIRTLQDGAVLGELVNDCFATVSGQPAYLPRQKLIDCIEYAVGANSHHTTMVLEFLIYLSRPSNNKPDSCQELHSVIVQKLASPLSIDEFSNTAEEVDPQNSHRVVEVLLQCHKFGNQTGIALLLGKILSQAKITPLYNTPYIPFLKILCNELVRLDVPLQGSFFQTFCQCMLIKYVQFFVGAVPQIPIDWSRPQSDCSPDCQDCNRLNLFLTSPYETVIKFAVGKRSRQHIKQQCEAIGGFSFKESSGSGNILAITKDLSGFNEALQDWKDRFDAAKAIFESFGEPLRRMLGDTYLAITSLSIDGLPQVNWDTRYFPEPPSQPAFRYLNRTFPFWGDAGKTDLYGGEYMNETRTLPHITKPRKTPVPSGAV